MRENCRIRTSLERVALSGISDQEKLDNTHLLGKKLAQRNVLLIDINDPRHTASITDRAAKLKMEVYGGENK